MEAHTILITLSRQLGSGGAYIGQRLAKRLGYKYVDREILKRMTEHFGIDEAALAARDERLSGFWEEIGRSFAHGIPEAGYVPPPVRPLYDKDLFEAEAAIIRELADKYNAVVVGRCGFHVLRGHPGLVNIFIHAPRGVRVKRVMRIYHVSDAGAAISMIDESDYQRGRFIRAMTGAQWNDARNYHLSIDTGKSGFGAAEQMIRTLVTEAKKRVKTGIA